MVPYARDEAVATTDLLDKTLPLGGARVNDVDWDAPPAYTFVLGAGFSRAISEAMPLTDEAGNRVVERLEVQGVPLPHRSMDNFTGGYFEAWLSRLAEDQPDLGEADNLANRSAFVRLAATLREVLAESQATVLSADPPQWLLRLVALWHETRSTVVTFNYDQLVEAAVMSLTISGPTRRVQAFDLVGQMPPLPSGSAFLGADTETTFRLLKLHGSLDWYWVPRDESGATLTRLPGSVAWGSPEQASADQIRRYVPGREPFLVPPASAKSAFYKNPITGELWRRAGRALEESTRVVLVGYSIPLTDTTTLGMLSERLRPEQEIQIVSPHPDDVLARLAYTGYTTDHVGVIPGYDCVADLVDQFEREVALAAARRIGHLITQWPGTVFAGVAPNRWAAAIDLVASEERIVVVLDEPTGDPFGTPAPVGISALHDHLDHAMRPIVVRTPDGWESSCVDVHPRSVAGETSVVLRALPTRG